MPLPAEDADAPAVDHLDRPGGDRHRSLDRARRVHRPADPRRGPARSRRARREAGTPPLRLAINFTPASLLDTQFEAKTFAAMVSDAGLSPTPDHARMHRAAGGLRRRARSCKQVKALRRLGFGFAIDDAGAGYASFTLIAALRPSIIKIDREIVARHRPRRREAGPRRGVRLVRPADRRPAPRRGHRDARADLAMLTSLGVELGQGYLHRQAGLRSRRAAARCEQLRLEAARRSRLAQGPRAPSRSHAPGPSRRSSRCAARRTPLARSAAPRVPSGR